MTERGEDRPPHLKPLAEQKRDRQDLIPGANVLGTAVLIGSLTMLFIASMVGYFYVRVHAAEWPPSGMPALPSGLWLSTVILLGTSLAIHRAIVAARANATPAVARWTLLTLGLGLAFLLVQAINWWQLVEKSLTPKVNLYGFTFYLLTGLHAAHVIGGLIPCAIVARKARRGAYSAAEHTGLVQCAMYWHFLDGVWVLVFLSLLLGS